LGYHCDKGLLSSLVSWIVAGNVTPSFVEGNANSSQVCHMMVLGEHPWDKQYVGVEVFSAFAGFCRFFSCCLFLPVPVFVSFLVIKPELSLRECCGFITLKGA